MKISSQSTNSTYRVQVPATYRRHSERQTNEKEILGTSTPGVRAVPALRIIVFQTFFSQLWTIGR